MEPISLEGLPESALLLIDSAPIIHVLEDHSGLAGVFKPVFEAHHKGRVRLAVTTVTLAEVLTGPLSAHNEALAERYRATLKSWFVVDLDAEVAESAARLRAACRLQLVDAVQAASALAIGADALVTHDRDFSALRDLRLLGIERPRPSPEKPHAPPQEFRSHGFKSCHPDQLICSGVDPHLAWLSIQASATKE
jgi:predicted nucleic acid-binding protein